MTPLNTFDNVALSAYLAAREQQACQRYRRLGARRTTVQGAALRAWVTARIFNRLHYRRLAVCDVEFWMRKLDELVDESAS